MRQESQSTLHHGGSLLSRGEEFCLFHVDRTTFRPRRMDTVRDVDVWVPEQEGHTELVLIHRGPAERQTRLRHSIGGARFGPLIREHEPSAEMAMVAHDDFAHQSSSAPWEQMSGPYCGSVSGADDLAIHKRIIHEFRLHAAIFGNGVERAHQHRSEVSLVSKRGIDPC